MIIDSTSAGPAFCDAAVPVSTKMPVPMIDPMPSAVRFSGPSERLRRPRSASARSASSDFFVKNPIPPMLPWRTATCLGRTDQFGTRLTRLQRQPVFGRGQTRVAFEHPREMALIVESGGRGDVAQRRAGAGELAPRELDPQMPDVAREGRLIEPLERTRQVHGMHADEIGDG